MTVEALRIMVERSLGSLVVRDSSDRVVGFVTQRDLLRCVVERGVQQYHTAEPVAWSVPVADVMTHSKDLVHLTPSDTLDEARSLMTVSGKRHVPVLSGDTLLGVIAPKDIARFLFDELHGDESAKEQYVSTVMRRKGMPLATRVATRSADEAAAEHGYALISAVLARAPAEGGHRRRGRLPPRAADGRRRRRRRLVVGARGQPRRLRARPDARRRPRVRRAQTARRRPTKRPLGGVARGAPHRDGGLGDGVPARAPPAQARAPRRQRRRLGLPHPPPPPPRPRRARAGHAGLLHARLPLAKAAEESGSGLRGGGRTTSRSAAAAAARVQHAVPARPRRRAAGRRADDRFETPHDADLVRVPVKGTT